MKILVIGNDKFNNKSIKNMGIHVTHIDGRKAHYHRPRWYDNKRFDCVIVNTEMIAHCVLRLAKKYLKCSNFKYYRSNRQILKAIEDMRNV